MKEIKAYIRIRKAEEVVQALEENGFEDLTLIHVMGIGYLKDPQRSKFSIEVDEKYSELTKLEVVCRDEHMEKAVQIIREKAWTGMEGDGRIFVTTVEYAMKILNGETGNKALE